jgi:hypothetical protein
MATRFHNVKRTTLASWRKRPFRGSLCPATTGAESDFEHSVAGLNELGLRKRLMEVQPHVVMKAVADPDCCRLEASFAQAVDGRRIVDSRTLKHDGESSPARSP